MKYQSALYFPIINQILIIKVNPFHEGSLTLQYGGQHSHGVNDPGHNKVGTTGSASLSGGGDVVDLDTFGTGNADNGMHTHSIP